MALAERGLLFVTRMPISLPLDRRKVAKILYGPHGKGSRTGCQFIERMETEGNLRWNASGGAEVQYVDPVTKAESWHPLNSTDMGHLNDVVKYWNETGRTLGSKHPDVRKWMLDPANYELQPSNINGSNGARLKDRYIPPLGDD